jgi:hypothetical protein
MWWTLLYIAENITIPFANLYFVFCAFVPIPNKYKKTISNNNKRTYEEYNRKQKYSFDNSLYVIFHCHRRMQYFTQMTNYF